MKVLPVKDLSAWNMPPRKPNGLRQDTRGSDVRPGWNLQGTQDSDDITSPTLCSEEEVGALK